ncbi:transport and Golgi organization 5 isoform X2 [Oratosquilla oratoria]|uniref:transport and Golgi organization 5 isoform X2 n=1 Tax=Oratosquilla oratoria TaxID=337810 RepID=UPI003F76A65A
MVDIVLSLQNSLKCFVFNMSVVLDLNFIENIVMPQANGFYCGKVDDDTSCNHVLTMGDSATQKRHKPGGSSKQQQANGSSMLGSVNGLSQSLEEKLAEKDDREKLVLWRRPLQTLHYFARECGVLSIEYLLKLWHNKKAVLAALLVFALFYGGYRIPGPHQVYIQRIEKEFWWCAYWVWLGILSSVGLGTGLHTFLLYLGPHIAHVTMAAYSCNSVNFPSPPYPDEIVCPDETEENEMSILSIMSKVRLEAFMWGAGTALGELPPYFMARGARLSGYDPDDEEMAEFEALQRLKERPEDMSWIDRAKLSIEKLVERVGFFGILLCASIPNPLFDLAGITCGHFLVPFWTFFGATLIGKAVVKMHIQKLFVIIAFNETLLAKAVGLLAFVPLIGNKLEQPFRTFLEKQKQKFHRKPGVGDTAQDHGNVLAWIFEKLILAMVAYFVISIITSFAQNYHKRIHKTAHEKKIAQD